HAAVEGLSQHVVAFPGGQQHDVGVVVGLLVALAYARGQLQAIHFRHEPVRHHDTGGPLLVHRQGCHGGAGEADVGVPSLGQRMAYDRAAELGIVHHHYAELRVWHVCAPCCLYNQRHRYNATTCGYYSAITVIKSCLFEVPSCRPLMSCPSWTNTKSPMLSIMP